MEYPVTLTKEADAYVVSFPDVPEAHTFGATKDAALAHAVNALWTALEMYVDAKRPFPKASARSGQTVTLPPLVVAKLRLYQEMVDQNVTKAELGRRLKWHGPQVDRLLNMRHGSQLDQLDAAFTAMGHRIVLSTVALPKGKPQMKVSALRGRRPGRATARRTSRTRRRAPSAR